MTTQQKQVTDNVTQQYAVSVPVQVPVTVMTTQTRQVPRQVAVTAPGHGSGSGPDLCRSQRLRPPAVRFLRRRLPRLRKAKPDTAVPPRIDDVS